jgi:hypothetical protein
VLAGHQERREEAGLSHDPLHGGSTSTWHASGAASELLGNGGGARDLPVRMFGSGFLARHFVNAERS